METVKNKKFPFVAHHYPIFGGKHFCLQKRRKHTRGQFQFISRIHSIFNLNLSKDIQPDFVQNRFSRLTTCHVFNFPVNSTLPTSDQLCQDSHFFFFRLLRFIEHYNTSSECQTFLNRSMYYRTMYYIQLCPTTIYIIFIREH